MEPPKIPHVVEDKARNNKYIFYAYRKLEDWELRSLLAAAFSGKKKKIGKNKVYQFLTVIGANDPIDDGFR